MEELGEEVTLVLMEGKKAEEAASGARAQGELLLDLREGELMGYTDGSRIEGVAAGATA